MRWYNDPDYFRISKAVVIADIDDMVEWLWSHPEGAETDFRALQDPDHPLHHSLDDINNTGLHYMDAEAVEMAIQLGDGVVKDPDTGKELRGVSRDLADILHYPPKSGELPSQQYTAAWQEALRIGKDLVNLAAREQNKMNAGRHSPAPEPFDKNGNLHPAYGQIIRGSLRSQTDKTRNIGDTDFSPYDRRQNSPTKGQLVTRMVSGYAGDIVDGRPGREEGFARWYEPAAKNLGLVNRRYSPKTGKAEGGHEFEIPAFYVHHNVAKWNDHGMINQAKKIVDEAKMSGGDIQSAIDDVKDMNVMHRRSSRVNMRDASRHHGRIGYDAERASNFEQGLGDPQTGEAMENGEIVGGSFVDESKNKPDHSIIGEELMDSNWGRWLATGAGNTTYANGPKFVREALKNKHGLSDDDLNEIFTDAQLHSSRGGKHDHRRKQDRIVAGIHHVVNRRNSTPGDYESQMQEQMSADESVIPPSPTRHAPPLGAPLRDREVPPEMRVRTGGPAVREPNMGGVIPNANEGLTIRPSLMSISGPPKLDPANPAMYTSQMNDYFTARALGLVKSDNDSPLESLSEYLEFVQVELAKATLTEYTDVKKMSLDDPLHVTLLASRIQRPSNDVISIFHTRGDWNNIAKSFGVDHSAVQLVKVALHG